MKISKRALRVALGIFFLSQIFFLIHIQFPRKPNFDEFHYVPSAKQFLELKENQNWEHPPLGKLIMSVGIALWGDRPLGWRYMSTVFGSLTLVGMYFLALVLFESESTALWVVLITLCNQLLYVQARIGMLDTFMFAFIVWAMAAYCLAWNPKTSTRDAKRCFAFFGLMVGFATACKWFGVIPWVCCALPIPLIRLLQNWKVEFKNPTKEDWYRPQLWKDIRLKHWVIYFGLIPVTVYYLTFLPFLWIKDLSIWDYFVGMQYNMWKGQLMVINRHPYMSQWLDWPLLRRPIWYAFDREGEGNHWVRGVLLLGNPLMMWGGIVALIDCFWGFKKRNRTATLILFFYCMFYFCWMFIPRRIAFYYYYYPSGMVLSLALAYVFHTEEKGKLFEIQWARWVFFGASLSLFIYFFPILAGLKIPVDSFRQWMWFSSWI